MVAQKLEAGASPLDNRKTEKSENIKSESSAAPDPLAVEALAGFRAQLLQQAGGAANHT